MFFTFLDKEKPYWLDLSVMEKYPPEKVLFYYYNSALTISIRTYSELLATREEDQSNKNLTKWYMIFEQLEVQDDIKILQESEFLLEQGPYYYLTTNTRLYFTKEYLSANNQLTIEDMDTLLALNSAVEIDKELYKYYKSRKNVKKTPKNKEELVKDIDMCINALGATESLNKHINYINKLLERRYSIVEKSDIGPMEPDNVPIKPGPSDDNSSNKDNVIPFSRKKTKKKQENNNYPSFNHETKVYFIRYREYEKACERYKLALIDWSSIDNKLFMDKCYEDIDIAEEKLKKATSILEIYNTIILKSFIHPDYQEISILETFKYYLGTGRSNDLQDCMNLFEEERHWKDIKASQTRIENTIYFLQSETDLTRFADENINLYLKQFNETAASLDKLKD